MTITGKTLVMGVIGNPVSHTASPKMHNAAFNNIGLDAVYIPLLVGTDSVKEALEGVKALSIRGINVTIPFKETVMPHLDHIDPAAKAIGAVNTIVNDKGTLTGYNTDGDGFIMSLKQEKNWDVSGQKVAILGSGGSAKSIANALCRSGAESLLILNRTVEKAKQLADSLSITFSECNIQHGGLEDSHMLASQHLVINTTPMGMAPHEDKLPLSNLEWVQPYQLIVDIIYNPKQTLFLQEAEHRQAQTLNGAGMLAGQGCIAFELFTGKQAPYTLFLNEVNTQ